MHCKGFQAKDLYFRPLWLLSNASRPVSAEKSKFRFSPLDVSGGAAVIRSA